MARTPFAVEVLTPEGEVWSGEVEMISTRTTDGSIGLLANHAPLLARLEPTELRLYTSDEEIVRYAQAEGYMQMDDNRALLLIEEAIEPAKLDRDALASRIQQATDAAAAAPAGSEELARAKRDARRAEAFLAVATGQD